MTVLWIFLAAVGTLVLVAIAAAAAFVYLYGRRWGGS
jgi:hypothetical protein